MSELKVVLGITITTSPLYMGPINKNDHVPLPLQWRNDNITGGYSQIGTR